MHLSGRVALVTGAGRGIGRCCATALAAAGADVALLSRTPAELEETAAQVRRHGRRALAVPCDVSEARAVEEAVRRAREELGPITVLIANAGTARSYKFVETTDEEWHRHFRVNVDGAFFTARAVVPDMLAAGWGRIVFTASVVSKQPAPYTAAYTASKHAVLGLCRAMALEYARRNITVNAVCPGFVDTDLTAFSIRNIVEKTGRTPGEARRALEDISPQRRLYTPEEVAAVAVFLTTDGAAGINGQGIVIDGGGFMS